MVKLFLAISLILGTSLITTRAAEAIDFTPTGTVVTVTYDEPATNTDGSGLNDLAKTTINWRVCPVVGTCATTYTQQDVPATSPSGNGAISRDINSPVAPGQERNFEVFATATDTSGNISAESTHVVKRIDRLAPSAPR